MVSRKRESAWMVGDSDFRREFRTTPRRSNRSEAAFNHSIADAPPDPSSCHGGDIQDAAGSDARTVCLSF